MKVVFSIVLLVFTQLTQAVIWFPAEPEVPESDIKCIDSDICCQQRYPKFVRTYSQNLTRKQNPILSTNVEFYNFKTPQAYATYYCQHTSKARTKDEPDTPNIPAWLKRRSKQVFTLRCGEDERLDEDKRKNSYGNDWKGGAGRSVAICVSNDSSDKTPVPSGSTVCLNKAAGKKRLREQVAEIYEILELDPEPDVEPMALSIAEVGQPSTTQQGHEALQIDVEYDRVYRACAARTSRAPGSGEFILDFGSGTWSRRS